MNTPVTSMKPFDAESFQGDIDTKQWERPTPDYRPFSKQRKSKDDEALLVTFYDRVLDDPNIIKSKEAGYAVYDTFIFCKIEKIMSKDVWDQPARIKDCEKYPDAWEMYARGHETPLHGTPLEKWSAIDAAMVKTLKYHSVHTVEQLAALDYQSVGFFGMNGERLQKLAKAYIAERQDGSATQKLLAENDYLREKIESQGAQLTQAMELLTKLSEAHEKNVAAPKKRGRPAKIESAEEGE